MTAPADEQERHGKRIVQPCSRLSPHDEHAWGTISWCRGEGRTRPASTEGSALSNPAVRAACEDAGIRHFIAGLLLEHQPSFQVDGDYGESQWVECSCDSDYYLDTDAGYVEHVQHQADVLTDRLYRPGTEGDR